MQQFRVSGIENLAICWNSLVGCAPLQFEKLGLDPKRQSAGKSSILKQVIGILSKQQMDVLVGLMLGDGHLDYRAKSHYAYHISTDSFTESEVQRLQTLLLERFGIVAKTYMSLCRGKRYPKLYIGKEGRDLFTKTIAPYLLSCFEYKIPPVPQKYTLTPQRLHAEPHHRLMGDDIVRSS